MSAKNKTIRQQLKRIEGALERLLRMPHTEGAWETDPKAKHPAVFTEEGGFVGVDMSANDASYVATLHNSSRALIEASLSEVYRLIHEKDFFDHKGWEFHAYDHQFRSETFIRRFKHLLVTGKRPTPERGAGTPRLQRKERTARSRSGGTMSKAHGDGGPASYAKQGMSLRDWFAGQATDDDVAYWRRQLGSKATREQAKYAYADAMLAAWEEQP